MAAYSVSRDWCVIARSLKSKEVETSDCRVRPVCTEC